MPQMNTIPIQYVVIPQKGQKPFQNLMGLGRGSANYYAPMTTSAFYGKKKNLDKGKNGKNGAPFK